MRIAALAPAPPRRRYAAAAVVLVLAAAGLFVAAGGPAPEPLVVRVDGGAAALAVSGGRVWAAAPRTSSIVVLDASSGESALAPLRVGGAPTRLALGASGVWVADAAAGTVMPVETRPARVLAPIRVGADANDIALSGRALWIASSSDSRVYVLDGKGASALRVGRAPVAVAADSERVLVADSAAGTLTVLDSFTRAPVGAPISVGGHPVDVALAGDTAWIADAGGKVVAVDVPSATVTRRVDVGGRAVALAVAGDDVYVVGDRRLLRVRDGRVASRRKLDADAIAVAVDRRYVWVAAGDAVLRYDR